MMKKVFANVIMIYEKLDVLNINHNFYGAF